MKRIVLMVAASLAVASSTQAITIVTQNGTSYKAAGVESYQTTGANMTGLQVWVAFSNGSVQSANWVGANHGATAADWFRVGVIGDTYNYLWSIQNLNSENGIVGFGFNGAAAGVLFDKSFPGFGTPGSANGSDFSLFASPAPRPGADSVAAATYRDIVSLVGQPPVGDLYASLSIQLDFFLGPGTVMQFRQDTDNSFGPLQSVPDTGMTLSLLALGMMCVAGLRRYQPPQMAVCKVR
jgi:hypothetical protein